ncbi:MAG: FeoA family protein [Planctomycetaceae bacterium]|jgi:ferrous iron transport protein A|nr:ferrous iron transport protein A [bacterium]MDG2388365.1 FeoA family protein [Planctomycetaceae bacterium]
MEARASRLLTDLRPGDSAIIAEIIGDDSLSIRLMEMGLLEGESVSLIGYAPLGDPIEFEIRGYRISLRAAEAQRVCLEAIS